MPRTFTISQTNALGERLRRTEHPAEADLQMLQRLRLDHDPALVKVEQFLRDDLGLEATSRLKTVGTIIDKLRREKTRLSKMQDIAGVRIVTDVNLREQDTLADSILNLLPSSELIDRREHPSFGYRAVHIIVTVDDCPVEIQIRTKQQDRWAQILEKIADSWGRQIRYGGEPTDPEARVRGRKEVSRREMLAVIMSASKLIAVTEQLTLTARDGLAKGGIEAELLFSKVQEVSAVVDGLLEVLVE